MINKKRLPPSASFSVLKKTQKEMRFPTATNTAFSPYSSLFFSDSPPLRKLFLLFLRKNLDFLVHHKKELVICLFLGISGITLSSYRLLALQEKQESVIQDLQQFKRLVELKKKDIIFLKACWPKLEAHQQNLKAAKKLTRFDVGEHLKELSQEAGFQEMGFTVMPEKKIFLKGGKVPALLTKISVSFKTRSDIQLMGWIRALSTHFPAFLVPRQLIIDRINAEGSSDHSPFEGVEGIYVFDWVRIEK